MDDTRIAIERFDNFDRCIIDGLDYGIRWVSCMEAYAAVPGKSRAEVAPYRLTLTPEQLDRRESEGGAIFNKGARQADDEVCQVCGMRGGNHYSTCGRN